MKKAKILSLALVVLLVALVIVSLTLPAAAEETLPEAGQVMTEDVVTEYGTIPAKFSNQTDYPFVIFKDQEFKGAYAYWYYTGIDVDGDGVSGKDDDDKQGAFASMRSYVGGTILMRRNYSISSANANDKYMSHLNGTMNIDLGGHTLVAGGSELFNVRNNHKTAKPTYNVKNGAIKLKGQELIQATSANSDRVVNINF